MTMSNKHYSGFVLFVVVLGVSIPMGQVTAQSLDAQTVDRGKYLVMIAGCNDCHTPGYLLSEGKTPEELWLTGDNFGWRGPWGTTYGVNLRIVVQALTEEQWVTFAQNFTARPPMAWFNLNHWKADDLRAIYQFIRSLGEVGEPAPAYVPPGEEPPPPYATFPPPPPTIGN